MSKKSGNTKSFIGGFLLGGILTPIVGYFTYKLVKPDYLKDYEEDDDFDDKKHIKKEEDFDDFDDIDDLDDC